MDFGFNELLLVMVIAFLLYGGRLPQIARALGHSVREFKKALNDVTDDWKDTREEIKESWTTFGPEEGKPNTPGDEKAPLPLPPPSSSPAEVHSAVPAQDLSSANGSSVPKSSN